MSDPTVVQVGSVAQSISDTHPRNKEQLIFLNTSDVLLGKVLHRDYSPVRSWPGQAKKSVKRNDILFSEIRPANGRWAFIDLDVDDVVVSTKLMVIRAITDKILPRFLYHFLTSNRTTSWLQHLAESRSGTFPQITFDQVAELKISLPSLSDQRRINSLLDALDDKVDLNRRMNETLEAMARAIFKDWFVDFGPTRAKAEGRAPYLAPEVWDLFPDALDDEDKPVDWEQVKIQDVAEKVAMGPFGSNIKVSTFVSEGIPIISGQHLNETMLEDNSFNFITLDHADKLKNSNVYRGDIVFTHAGNIGQVSYIPESSAFDRYVLSQRQFYLRCNAEIVSPFFLIYFFKSPDGQHKLLANTSSTGVPSISRPATNLKAIEFCLPSKNAIDAFDILVGDLHKKIGNNRKETKTLAQTRDVLLPKLMSGEIRLHEAEKAVEAVA